MKMKEKYKINGIINEEIKQREKMNKTLNRSK